MTIGHALGTPCGRGVAIGIFNGVEAVLHQCLRLVEGEGEAMPHADIDHEQRCGANVLTELKVFVKAQTVGRPVAPVLVPVTRTRLDGTDGFFPLEGVGISFLTFYIATAGEPHETGMGVGQQLGQVRTQAIGASLISSRKQRDHVKIHGSAGIGEQLETALVCVFRGTDGSGELVPLSGRHLARDISLSDDRSVLADQTRQQVSAECALSSCPESKGVSRVLAEGHAPVTGVGNALGTRGRSILGRYYECVGLCVIQQVGGGKVHSGSIDSRPSVGAVLKGTVLHQFGIKSAFSGMVDLLEKQTILIRTGQRSTLGSVDRHRHLCGDMA